MMKRILSGGIALVAMLFLVAVAPVYGNVASSASITNAAPAITAITTYSSYTNRTSNTPNSTFGPNTTVFIQVNVSDANEHFDITDNGYVKIKIVLFNGSAESDFTRFGTGYSLNATLESGYDIYTTYTASFNMSSSDATRLGAQPYAGNYRIKVSVSDGTNVTTSNISASQNADYAYSNSTPVATTAGFDGSTTDLSAVDMHNVSNLVVEKSAYGKINFTSAVNFTQNANLSLYVNISDNFISIDSAVLPELDEPAIISFYNLTFSDPIILRDGAVCSSSVCNQISYAGGTLVFSVTGFTDYSAHEAFCGDGSCNGGETCSSCSGDCGHCSGGGGGCLTNWTCTAWSACSGGTQTRSCSKVLSYCYAEGQPEVLRNCSVEQPAISNNTEQPAAPVAAVLFDIDLKIVKNEIFSSETLSAVVSLTNIGRAGEVIVRLNYMIIDSAKGIVYSESERTPVETQLQFIKEFDISRLREGSYKLSAGLSYEGQKEPAQSADVFVVKAVPSPIGIWPVGGFAIFADEKEFVIFTVFAIIVIAYTAIRMRSKKAKMRI